MANSIPYKISIIVPMFNTSKYISACLDSLISQDEVEKAEIIVINDGSTDNSRDTVEEYINNHKGSNIKLINQENKGLSNARNVGVTSATGEYLMFVDSDDYLLPGCFARLNREIDKEKYDIVTFGLYTSNEAGKIISEKEENLSYRGELFVPNDRRIVTIPLVAFCKVFNRSWYKENELAFSEGILYEDISVIPYAISRANWMYVCEEKYYVYRQRKSSIMNRKIDNKCLDVLKSNEILRKRFEESETFEKYKSELEIIAIKTIIFQILYRINAENCSDSHQDLLLHWLETQYPNYFNNKYLTKREKEKIEPLRNRRYREFYFKYGMVFNIVRYSKDRIPPNIYKAASDIKRKVLRE